jgi:nicotinamide mononucleotide transporter
MPNLIQALDISGAVFAFISTVYYVKADNLAWPTGLISSSFNIILFALTGIYGDMGCEVIYFVSMFYGWYFWTHSKGNQTERPITHLTRKQFFTLTTLALTGITLLSLFLWKYTNSQVPLWDASTTVLALSAQWMICRKIIQCWYLWFIVDALYIGLYFHKGIPAHGILFMVYLGLAIAGFLNWRRIRNQSAISEYDLPELNLR